MNQVKRTSATGYTIPIMSEGRLVYPFYVLLVPTRDLEELDRKSKELFALKNEWAHAFSAAFVRRQNKLSNRLKGFKLNRDQIALLDASWTPIRKFHDNFSHKTVQGISDRIATAISCEPLDNTPVEFASVHLLIGNFGLSYHRGQLTRAYLTLNKLMHDFVFDPAVRLVGDETLHLSLPIVELLWEIDLAFSSTVGEMLQYAGGLLDFRHSNTLVNMPALLQMRVGGWLEI